MNSSTSSFKYVIAFALVILGSAELLKYVFDRPNWKTMAVASLTSHPPEIVFLGSSVFYYGVDPRHFTKPTVNLAGSYLSFSAMQELWETHEAKLAQVKTVVLELNHSALSYDTWALAQKDLIDLGLSPTPAPRDFVRSFDASVHRLFWPFFTWRLTPLFYREWLFRLGDAEEPLDAVPGFVPSRLSMGVPDLYAEREVEKAERMLAKVDPAVEAANRAAGRALVAKLQNSGRKVMLARFPQSAALRRIYPAAWTARLDAAAKEFGAPVLDLRALAGFEELDFRDPDHLNERGAAKLAAHLESVL